MRLQRLGWAGLEIECDGESLVIDYVQDKSPMAPFLRNPHEWFPACSRPGDTAAALLTHLHADHADPDALAKHYGRVRRSIDQNPGWAMRSTMN